MSSRLTDRGGNHEGGNGNEYFPSHKQHSFSYLYLSTFYKSRLDCASCYFNKKKSIKSFCYYFPKRMHDNVGLSGFKDYRPGLCPLFSLPQSNQQGMQLMRISQCVYTYSMWKNIPSLLCGDAHLQGTWGHRGPCHTHTDRVYRTCMTGDQLPVALYSNLRCAYLRKTLLTSSFTCSRKWSHFFISLFLSHLFPHLFFCSFYFNNFRLSFFEATQSATSEKVISDSSLYWD